MRNQDLMRYMDQTINYKNEQGVVWRGMVVVVTICSLRYTGKGSIGVIESGCIRTLDWCGDNIFYNSFTGVVEVEFSGGPIG